MRLCHQTKAVDVHKEERMNLQMVMKKVNLLVAHELHVSLRAVLQGDAVGRVVY